MVTVNSYPSIQKYIINPYYEKRGEVNPELALTKPAEADEAVFADMGGKEKPVDLKAQPVKTSKDPAKQHKGKIISWFFWLFTKKLLYKLPALWYNNTVMYLD